MRFSAGKGFDSFEWCGDFLGDPQVCLITGLAASAREFRQSQADDAGRLHDQHR
jgi:hypothetical protein